MKQLILGGARSGKSQYAQQQAIDSGLQVVYVATAQAGDAEMRARIEQHKNNRPSDWQLVEEPIRLADVLQQQDGPGRCLLVDCLTLWLTNLLCHDDPSLYEYERDRLLTLLPGLQASVLLVSNEVGQGIVPLGELNRRFVDEAGWLHQALAAQSERVVWIMAGLPQVLKG
ncbi:MAG: bifunctional adenosylcobinamide kinase/adenosylcobinamide-phosphate guanylyltransferase [Gammaproteobacteria bacterium]|nr:bifunctional adenosylcobinamide kinase/adenosylcobinamide-phosphate guanylyltransferase [Gammaproteobacteria bacterium]